MMKETTTAVRNPQETRETNQTVMKTKTIVAFRSLPKKSPKTHHERETLEHHGKVGFVPSSVVVPDEMS